MKRFILPLFALAVFFTSSCDDTTNGVGVSLTDITDKIDVAGATFTVSSESMVIDSVLSRSTIGYLGKVKDPETGSYITSNFSTQFHTLNNFQLPAADSIASKFEGMPSADSVEVIVYFNNSYGDSLTTMKCTLHELDHPLEENKPYYSSFSPLEKGYVRKDGIHKVKSYTLIDYSVSESEREATVPNFRISLNEAYTDKQGKTYNNYGTYILSKYYEHPEYFTNSQAFMKYVCPGFYIKSESGLGCMAYIDLTQLNVYYKEILKDTIVSKVASFAGTEEVLQTTNISQNKEELNKLAENKSCTYIKSPSGIFTQLTLPVDEILEGHENDTINTARMTITRENNTVMGNYVLPAPNSLLILPSDSVHSFFAKAKIADYRTSFITTLSSNSYSFGNIATLIRFMADKRQAYISQHPGVSNAEYSRLFPNWNKATLVPVTTSYTTISTSSVLSRVANDMSLSCTKLYGGPENPDAIKISVIYTKFK